MISHREGPRSSSGPREAPPVEEDRLWCPAPLNFDLSIFDLFAGCGRRLQVVLPGEPSGLPRRLAHLITGADHRLVLGAVDSHPARDSGNLGEAGLAGSARR